MSHAELEKHSVNHNKQLVSSLQNNVNFNSIDKRRIENDTNPLMKLAKESTDVVAAPSVTYPISASLKASIMQATGSLYMVW